MGRSGLDLSFFVLYLQLSKLLWQWIYTYVNRKKNELYLHRDTI